MIKNKTGFTLVELLISISIIAILSIVLSVSFSKAQQNARDQRRIDDLKSIQNAAEQMVFLSGTYPTSVNFYKSTSPAWKVGDQVVLQNYPEDPKNTDSFVYTASGISANGYCVCASMEVSKNSNAENSSCSFTNADGYYCVRNQQ